MILKEVLENLKDRQSRAQILAEYNYKRALEDERFYQIEKNTGNITFVRSKSRAQKFART